MAAAGRPDENRADAGVDEYRHIHPLSAEFEADNGEALTFLRALSAGAGRLCDYPFTILYLDTYHTYVRCQATDRYLYGRKCHPWQRPRRTSRCIRG